MVHGQNLETRSVSHTDWVWARCQKGFQATYLYLTFLWRRFHLRLGLGFHHKKTFTFLLLGDLLAASLALAMASAFWTFFLSLISSNHWNEYHIRQGTHYTTTCTSSPPHTYNFKWHRLLTDLVVCLVGFFPWASLIIFSWGSSIVDVDVKRSFRSSVWRNSSTSFINCSGLSCFLFWKEKC